MIIASWSPVELREHVDEALGVYCAAMGYPAETAVQRKGYVVVHTQRPGFRAVGACTDRGTVVGFAYGYRGGPGQWWHDEVRRDLSHEMADRWLSDSFELCELHVLPDFQGHGVGQRLLTLLLDGCPYRTVVLSTPEGESRAWRLYRRLGFVDVHRQHRFAGDDREFAVLGRRLPLEPAPAEAHG